MLLCGQSNQLWHWAAGKHPGKVGMILGPSYFKKQAIRFWMPYALDNDAYGAWVNKTPWDEASWREMLQLAKMSGYPPLWALVPDVVADRDATLANWYKYSPDVRRFGWPVAFAAQDGMMPSDVPTDADVVFIGGTTGWKWNAVPVFSRAFHRVHVGRVNSLSKLYLCEDLKVESCDGSGWFRGTSGGRQGRDLIWWLEGVRDPARQIEFL